VNLNAATAATDASIFSKRNKQAKSKLFRNEDVNTTRCKALAADWRVVRRLAC
jgi:hypothetical protein